LLLFAQSEFILSPSLSFSQFVGEDSLPITNVPISVRHNSLLLDSFGYAQDKRQIQQEGSGSGDPLRAIVIY
jgi:hypothetical protein